MATHDIRPDLDQLTTGWSTTPLWSKVDDPWSSPDDGTTEIETSSTGTPFRVRLKQSDIDAIDEAKEKIVQVELKHRWRPGGFGGQTYTTRTGFRVGGGGGVNVWGSGKDRTGGGGYGNDSTIYTERPGGAAWSKETLADSALIGEYTAIPANPDTGNWTQIIARVTTEPLSILEQICRELMARILTLSDITSSKTGFKVKGWQTLKRPPAVFIAPAGENSAPGPTKSMTNQVIITLPTVVKGADPLVDFFDLYKRIKEVVDADPSLGGLAIDAWVSGYVGLVTDESITPDLHVSDIFVTVDYRHDRGSP
jgi:hypothetical protein